MVVAAARPATRGCPTCSRISSETGPVPADPGGTVIVLPTHRDPPSDGAAGTTSVACIPTLGVIATLPCHRRCPASIVGCRRVGGSCQWADRYHNPTSERERTRDYHQRIAMRSCTSLQRDRSCPPL